MLRLPAGKGGFVQDEQLAHWYAYVAWEASNVQRLDQGALAARVVLAYEQVPDEYLAASARYTQCTLVHQHANEHLMAIVMQTCFPDHPGLPCSQQHTWEAPCS